MIVYRVVSSNEWWIQDDRGIWWFGCATWDFKTMQRVGPPTDWLATNDSPLTRHRTAQESSELEFLILNGQPLSKTWDRRWLPCKPKD
jgi:hypothetical protein